MFKSTGLMLFTPMFCMLCAELSCAYVSVGGGTTVSFDANQCDQYGSVPDEWKCGSRSQKITRSANSGVRLHSNPSAEAHTPHESTDKGHVREEQSEQPTGTAANPIEKTAAVTNVSRQGGDQQSDNPGDTIVQGRGKEPSSNLHTAVEPASPKASVRAQMKEATQGPKATKEQQNGNGYDREKKGKKLFFGKQVTEVGESSAARPPARRVDSGAASGNREEITRSELDDRGSEESSTQGVKSGAHKRYAVMLSAVTSIVCS